MLVIKYGGHALPEVGTADPVIEFLAKFHKNGNKFVLVHGGGPQINAELAIHGIKTEMAGGYRKTTPEVFEVVQSVLSGTVLRTLVNQFISYGISAVGLSASDGNLIRAKQRNTELGLVGDVTEVNAGILNELLNKGYLPIVSPIGVSDTGVGLNLNADLVAGAIGGALGSNEVLFMTDVAGIYRNWPDTDSLINEISSKELNEIKASFEEGMVPKVEAVLNAIASGAKQARIFDGRDVRNLELALAGATGTVITK